MRDAEGEHDEAIQSKGDPCAGRHPVGECGEEAFVGLHGRKPGLAPLLRLLLESPPLLVRVRQLVVAVRELDPVNEQLEAFRPPAVPGASHPGEGRLARRVVVEEDRAGAGQLRKTRLHPVGEEEIEAAVPAEPPGGAGVRPGRPRPRPQRLLGLPVHVDPGQPRERLRVGDPARRAASEHEGGELPGLVHEPVMVEARPVPLQQGEFRVVPGTALPGPERAADLEDGAAAGREHPLHRVFGGGLKPAHPPVRAGRGEARDGRVHRPAGGEDRGLHLEDPAGGEEIPEGCDDRGAPFPAGAGAARAPVRGRFLLRSPRRRTTP